MSRAVSPSSPRATNSVVSTKIWLESFFCCATRLTQFWPSLIFGKTPNQNWNGTDIFNRKSTSSENPSTNLIFDKIFFLTKLTLFFGVSTQRIFDEVVFWRKVSVQLKHTSTVPTRLLNTTLWFDTSKKLAFAWVQLYSKYAEFVANREIPVQIVFYENLKKNSTFEMQEILRFFKEKFKFSATDGNKRVRCLEKPEGSRMNIR